MVYFYVKLINKYVNIQRSHTLKIFENNDISRSINLDFVEKTLQILFFHSMEETFCTYTIIYEQVLNKICKQNTNVFQ